MTDAHKRPKKGTFPRSVKFSPLRKLVEQISIDERQETPSDLLPLADQSDQTSPAENKSSAASVPVVEQAKPTNQAKPCCESFTGDVVKDREDNLHTVICWMLPVIFVCCASAASATAEH